MTRTRWLLLGVLAMVAVTAVVLSRRGPAGITVDTVRATRQSRFVSTVTASGEIVATRYADIGSSVMGKIVSLPVAEGERVRAGQVLARIDAVQAESGLSSAQAQVLALAATVREAPGSRCRPRWLMSWLPKRVRLTRNSSSAGRRSCSALGCWQLPSSKPPGLLPTTRVRRSPQHVRR
jgi:multidrug efflux pump subunit AcrA (membrane-fusion protein)